MIHIFRRDDKEELSSLSATRQSEGAEPSSEDMNYIHAELTLSTKGQYADEKRLGVEWSMVALAFPVDRTGAAKPEPTSNVFA